MAAVLLRRHQPPSASSSAHSPEAQAHLNDFAALELAALWVDPTLEDRAEVTCCLLVYLQQYLLAWDAVRELHAGGRCQNFAASRLCMQTSACRKLLRWIMMASVQPLHAPA